MPTHSLNFNKKRTNTLNVHEKHTFSEKGRHFYKFCENDARFPRVEFVDFPKNSQNFHEKHINSLNVHEKHTFSEKGCHFREFCENDARFPRVEFVDFLHTDSLIRAIWPIRSEPPNLLAAGFFH